MLQPLVVVVDSHRQHALGALLADHVVVQRLADFAGRRHAAVLLARDASLGFLTNDVVAQLDTLIADENRRARDQLAHFMLALAAERAIKGILGIAAVAAADLAHFTFLPAIPASSPDVWRLTSPTPQRQGLQAISGYKPDRQVTIPVAGGNESPSLWQCYAR